MIEVRDTFLHFLADNLTSVLVDNVSYPINVHNVRRDTNDPQSENLLVEAVNVKFINTDYGMYISQQTVSIDLLYSNELVCAAVSEALFTLLKQAAYTPKLDYTNISNPVTVGYTIYWEPAIKFKPIHDLMYTHFHARLVLNHYQQQ